MTLHQPLRENDITPGLLPVLQTIVVLRSALLLIGSGLIAIVMRRLVEQPDVAEFTLKDGRFLALLFVLEPILLLIFVFWPRVRRRFGPKFLIIALGWLLLTPIGQQIVGLLALPADFLGRGGQRAFYGVGFESVWLAVPVMLAAWQFGRQGWRWAVGALIAAHAVIIAISIWALDDSDVIATVVLGAIATVATITLLGWVVLRLVEALRAEHDALTEANRQLAQRAATIEQLAESRERNRLARELHDTLAHSLTGVSVQLQALGTLLKHDPEAASDQLVDAQTTVREGIQESRRAIEALRATPLEDLGLPEALRRLCSRQAERTGIRFKCEIDNVEALDPLTEQAIYRVAEAALANAVQHAAATEIRVRLGTEPDLLLEISDNGIGFDPESISADRFGLAGMVERANMVGAELRIESAPGRGAQVRMEVRS